jgi:hypothetical protein
MTGPVLAAGAARRALAAALRGALQCADDRQQVGFDGSVHLDEPALSLGLGCGDQLTGLGQLIAVLGQELGRGDEQRAGQARFSELTMIMNLFADSVARQPCGGSAAAPLALNRRRRPNCRLGAQRGFNCSHT